MWIFSQHGFASAVQHRRNHDLLMVRFRDHQDAVRYAKALVTANQRRVRLPRIWRDDHADYLWRFVCPKHQWAELLAELTDEVDYANFKSMMHDRAPNWSGQELMGIWSITNNHQWEADNQRRRRNQDLRHHEPTWESVSDDDEIVISHEDRWAGTVEKEEPGPF
jgi:hypothetical protein